MPELTIHQLKISFNVTEQVKRFVYVYIIESGNLYLVDSGVYGSEKQIMAYLTKIGRTISEIKGIFLTHSHPDHIGSAAWFRQHTGCKIYASEGEKPWIEDIDLQFSKRPIPNFYNLAGKSSRVDVVVQDGDVIRSDDGFDITVYGTSGHSHDDVSYRAGHSLFIGDAVPVTGDIPIFIDESAMRNSLDVIGSVPDVTTYFPAWDQTYPADVMKRKLREAASLADLLKKTVTEADKGQDLSILTDNVCDRLQAPMLKANPLFKRTVACLRNKQG